MQAWATTSHNVCHATDHEDTSDDDSDYSPGQNSDGEESGGEGAGSLALMICHPEVDHSHSANESVNSSQGKDSHPKSEEEGSKEEWKKTMMSMSQKFPILTPINHSMMATEAFAQSKMAKAWKMF